jgi:hypothetical protein
MPSEQAINLQVVLSEWTTYTCTPPNPLRYQYFLVGVYIIKGGKKVKC